jgi:bacillolysin
VTGDTVVWSRIHLENARPAFGEIVARKSLGPMKTIYAGGTIVMNPSVDGRLVAWESVGGNSDIQARYMGSRVRTLAGGRGDQLLPYVDGDWVAWWNNRGQPKIEAYNMRSGARRVVKAKDAFTLIGPPSVSGRYLLWYQDDGFDGAGSIRRLDLRTGKKKVIVPEDSGAGPVWVLGLTNPPIPSANDRFVVYSSELNYAIEFGLDSDLVENEQVGRDIFIVPLGGGEPQLVTNNRADQAFPSLGSGRRVIWLDSSGGRTDLVTREVP